MKIKLMFRFAVFLSVLVLAGCGPAEATDQVTGTIFYLPRIALPPDAKVTVRISDVSIADIKAEVLGEQTYTTEGKQVPLPFAVAYDGQMIDPAHNYAVSARIEDADGNLLFISDTVYFVITKDYPTEDIEIKVVQVP